MNMTPENVGDVTVIVLPGEYLDVNHAKELKRHLLPMLTDKTKVVLDMSQLQFVDSAGLAVILSCLRQVNSAGGNLELCGLTKPVRVLFELIKMHRIFDIFNTKEEAISAFSSTNQSIENSGARRG